jgi:hypothetical protein
MKTRPRPKTSSISEPTCRILDIDNPRRSKNDYSPWERSRNLSFGGPATTRNSTSAAHLSTKDLV